MTKQGKLQKKIGEHMPTIICTKCGQKFSVDNATIGKECECECGHKFVSQAMQEMPTQPFAQVTTRQFAMHQMPISGILLKVFALITLPFSALCCIGTLTSKNCSSESVVVSMIALIGGLVLYALGDILTYVVFISENTRHPLFLNEQQQR